MRFGPVPIQVLEETGRISIAAYGELVQGLSSADVLERVNRHFEVQRPTPMAIDEFTADIPLAQGEEGRPAERMKP